MTTQPNDADWTTEIGTITPDTALTMNRRDLFPQQLTKLQTVSLRALQASADIEPVLKDRLSYKVAVSSEKGFLVGSGSGQPLGVFTASSNGIPTTQDTVTAANNAFTADNVIDTLYSIPQQYLNSNKFAVIGHRTVIGYVRKLKDNYGQYLLQMGIASNRPDTLLGVPVKMSEYAPAITAGSFTPGQYVLCFGDYRFYTWAEVIPMYIQRLMELFAASSEIGLMIRYWADGSPVLPQAFARLQIKSS